MAVLTVTASKGAKVVGDSIESEALVVTGPSDVR